jgi:glucose-1-phosphate thymidylyltransferase
MRAADPGARLTPDQQRAADAGVKAMMPVNGRPFLDYVLSSLADAGITDAAIIVAPDHEDIRRYYAHDVRPARLRIGFVVQEQPLGTAHALLCAEAWAGGEPFLAINGDNLYPAAALRSLLELEEPGLAAFDREDLIRSGNIPADRIRAFAIIEVDARGYLARIVEKPPQDTHQQSRLISMNCWRFDRRIFSACRAVTQSERGEFELPQAVGVALSAGVAFRAVEARGAVLDLSRRADAAVLADLLAPVVPRL